MPSLSTPGLPPNTVRLPPPPFPYRHGRGAVPPAGGAAAAPRAGGARSSGGGGPALAGRVARLLRRPAGRPQGLAPHAGAHAAGGAGASGRRMLPASPPSCTRPVLRPCAPPPAPPPSGVLPGAAPTPAAPAPPQDPAAGEEGAVSSGARAQRLGAAVAALSPRSGAQLLGAPHLMQLAAAAHHPAATAWRSKPNECWRRALARLPGAKDRLAGGWGGVGGGGGCRATLPALPASAAPR
jgi:hypothetical protein